MCGIVGLFVGCAAVSSCPKRRLLNGSFNGEKSDAPEEMWRESEGNDYRSPFKGWDRRVGVRASPRRELSSSDEMKLFFAPELVPVAQHPLVERLGPGLFEQVILQHLYRYLDFTTSLEQLVVNRTVLGIAHGSIGVEVPEEMRFDAHKIYCDEAYHALFSQDLMRQTVARTGVAPRLPHLPYFLVRLQQLQERLPPERRLLAELLFVIVSETLISGTLADVPKDQRVVAAVSEVIRDHAADEGRHHAYFAAFLRILWGALTPAERGAGAVLVPELVHAFLTPDCSAMRAELCSYGLSTDEAEEVLSEVWPGEVVAASVRASAARTV